MFPTKREIQDFFYFFIFFFQMRKLRISLLINAQFFHFNAQIARCAALTLSLGMCPVHEQDMGMGMQRSGVGGLGVA